MLCLKTAVMGSDTALWYLLSFFLSCGFQVTSPSCRVLVQYQKQTQEAMSQLPEKQNRTIFFSFSPKGNGSYKSRVQCRQPEEAVCVKPWYWAHQVLYLRDLRAAELPAFCCRNSSWQDRCGTQRWANKCRATEEEGQYLPWEAPA